MEELKDRLRSERMKMGLYQQDLADNLKVSKQTVSHWETGQRTPDALTIKILADLFNVTTDYLLCRVDNPVEVKQLNDIEKLKPELKTLIENAKDLPINVINSINNLVLNWKESYKVITTVDDNDIQYVLNTDINPNGLTPEEEKQMIKLIKRLQEIQDNK